MSSATLVVIGSINYDQTVEVGVLPSAGETVVAQSAGKGLGGKGANQAIASAEAGVNVEFVGAVGANGLGISMLNQLQQIGVGTAGIQQCQAVESGQATVVVDAAGENLIIVVPGANMHVAPADVDAALETLSAHAPITHVLCQAEIPLATVDHIAHICAQRGIRFILNLAPFGEVAKETIDYSDPLIVNVHEAISLLAHIKNQPLSELKEYEESPEMLIRELQAHAKSVVVTLGSAGALLAESENITHVPAHKTTVVDTTGAGDAFTGVLAARLARNESLEEAAKQATAAAALVVSRLGANSSHQIAAPRKANNS